MGISLAVLGLSWAFVAYIIFAIIRGFLVSRHNTRMAKELKCEEPAHQKNKLPFGIDVVLRALKADNEKLFPVDLQQRTADVGAITYRYSILGAHNVMTADEKNIQAILATQFADFDLGPRRRNNFFPLLGNGIFTQDGKAWERSRAMMRPQFAREQVSDLDLEERHIQIMMRALPTDASGWTEKTDLQVLFFRLTLDSATEFLFGESVDSQLAGLPDFKTPAYLDPANDEHRFAFAFDAGQMAIATRLRFADMYWAVRPKNFSSNIKACHNFIDHFVGLALQKPLNEASNAEKGAKKEKYVFLEALAQETRDPIELRSQLLHILLAGRDTTASLLGWLFFSLARDPTRYAKLRTAILDAFGSYEQPDEITFAKLKACQYLQYCLNEALRLYPVVPINGRTANKDTTLPRGGGPDGTAPIFIPKGSEVDYSVHVMHHRKDLWGDDAEVFNPERWIGRKVGWDFLPFNGGPRICIGQQFALTEASYVAVRLCQRFDRLENLETDEIVRHRLTLTSCPGSGVNVRLHAASL